MHLSNGWLSKFFCLYNFAFADDHKVDSSIVLVLLEDVQMTRENNMDTLNDTHVWYC